MEKGILSILTLLSNLVSKIILILTSALGTTKEKEFCQFCYTIEQSGVKNYSYPSISLRDHERRGGSWSGISLFTLLSNLVSKTILILPSALGTKWIPLISKPEARELAVSNPRNHDILIWFKVLYFYLQHNIVQLLYKVVQL